MDLRTAGVGHESFEVGENGADGCLFGMIAPHDSMRSYRTVQTGKLLWGPGKYYLIRTDQGKGE